MAQVKRRQCRPLSTSLSSRREKNPVRRSRAQRLNQSCATCSRSPDACAGSPPARQAEPVWHWGGYTLWRSQKRSRTILGYRERKCNIKYEGMDPRFMTDEQPPREICSMRNCNHVASYFESGMFWCKYCYWLNSSKASPQGMKYLDVIAC